MPRSLAARPPGYVSSTFRFLLRIRLLLALFVLGSLVGVPAAAQDLDPSEIFFPVQVTDDLQYSDTYGACRDGCSRGHLGVDLMTPQMTPVFAAQSGTIAGYRDYCNDERTYCSYYLLLSGDDGRSYFYVHLNDDTPGRPSGTCDHRGGYDNAVAPRLFEAWQAGGLKGLRVERGEHLGWAGSAGTGCGVDHLHFEVWEGQGWTQHYSHSLNPYPLARAAHDAGNFYDESWPVDNDPMARLAGPDRYATSAKLSASAFERAGAVVLAPADRFVEALLGAPLAAAMDAPVLLVRPGTAGDRVPDSVTREINRLGASYAVVIGGTDRIGRELEAELAADTGIGEGRVRRLAGKDEGELSAVVAAEVLATHGIAVPGTGRSQGQSADPDAEVAPLLAAGSHPLNRGWPDALAASVLAARQIAPILLTPHDELHPDIARVLAADGISEVRVTGGPGAVAEQVVAAIEAQGVPTRRIAGSTRYETGLAIAEEAIADGASPRDLVVATGENFPDALTAGAPLARADRAMILVHGTSMLDVIQEWVVARRDEIDSVTAAGGTTAVSRSVLLRVAQWAYNSPA